MRWLSAASMLLLTVILSAILFCIAYAALHWLELRSTHLFDALNSDISQGLRLLIADVMQQKSMRRIWLATAISSAATLVICSAIFFALRRPKTSDAKFLSLIDAKDLGLTRKGGVFIGRLGGSIIKVPGRFTERGSGRKSKLKPRLSGGQKLWIDGDDTGGFVIGPPRSGKGAALIIPNCLMWPHSLIVLDMRGETYDATAGHRQTFSRVVRFSPADESGNTETYNPLDFVSTDPDQRDIDINTIAAALLPTPQHDAYWTLDGRALFCGIVSWVLENPDIALRDKNIGTILRIIEGTETPLRDWLLLEGGAGRNQITSHSHSWTGDFTRSCLARFAVMADKQFDGVYGTLAAAVKPFKNERILRATATSTFDIRAMRRDNISLYLDFRIQQVASIGPIFNVLITQFMDYMSRDMIRPHEKRVLVLLDEFQNLGKLENALTVATVLGGYGVPTWFFVQSLRSIDNLYTREGRQTLVNAARAQVFFGAQDPEDQRYVSQLLGERTDVITDTSISGTMFDQKRTSIQSKHVMRPLMRPDEVGSMNEAHCIIKLRNQQPILGVRNLYYADRLLAKLAWMPVNKSATSATAPMKITKTGASPVVASLASFPPISPQLAISVNAPKPGLRFAELAKPSCQMRVAPEPSLRATHLNVEPTNYAMLAAEIETEVEEPQVGIEALINLLPTSKEAANLVEALKTDIEIVFSE
jgi:type IV secretory pathway TraG/TraD family ATPase VirD4